MVGWVSGLVLESLAFGQAFFFKLWVGWVFGLPVGLELLGFGLGSELLKLRFRIQLGWHGWLGFWTCLGKQSKKTPLSPELPLESRGKTD